MYIHISISTLLLLLLIIIITITIMIIIISPSTPARAPDCTSPHNIPGNSGSVGAKQTCLIDATLVSPPLETFLTLTASRWGQDKRGHHRSAATSHIYIYICVCVYIYIYIYIERERETQLPTIKCNTVSFQNLKFVFAAQILAI